MPSFANMRRNRLQQREHVFHIKSTVLAAFEKQQLLAMPLYGFIGVHHLQHREHRNMSS